MSLPHRNPRRASLRRLALLIAAAATPSALLLGAASAPAAYAATEQRAGSYGKVEFGVGWTDPALVIGTEGAVGGRPVGLIASAEMLVHPSGMFPNVLTLPLDHDELLTITLQLQEKVDDPTDLSPLPQWQTISERTAHGRFDRATVDSTVDYPRQYFPIDQPTWDSPPYRIVYDVTWVNEATGATESHLQVFPQGVSDVSCLTADFACARNPEQGSVTMLPRA